MQKFLKNQSFSIAIILSILFHGVFFVSMIQVPVNESAENTQNISIKLGKFPAKAKSTSTVIAYPRFEIDTNNLVMEQEAQQEFVLSATSKSSDISNSIEKTAKPEASLQSKKQQAIKQSIPKKIIITKQNYKLPENPDNDDNSNGFEYGFKDDRTSVPITRYTQALSGWVKSFIKPPKIGVYGSGTVALSVDKDGNITFLEIAKSTGNRMLDQAMYDLVLDANPLIPPPPEAVQNIDHVVFKINITMVM